MRKTRLFTSIIAVLTVASVITACSQKQSSETTAAATTAVATTATATEATTAAETTEKATEAASEMGPAMKRIKESGQIIYGIDSSYPPISFLDPKDSKPYGVFIEFGDRLADKLGVEAVYKPEEFSTLISDLTTDNIDVLDTTVTVTEERKQVMMFADTMLKLADSLIVPADKADQYTDLNSFAGKTIAANSGTSQFQHASSVPNANVVAVNTTADGVLQVLSGTVDAAVVDNITGQQYILKHPGELKIITDANFGYEEDTVSVNLGNDDLLQACNEVIAEMMPDMDQMVLDYTQMALDMMGTS